MIDKTVTTRIIFYNKINNDNSLCEFIHCIYLPVNKFTCKGKQTYTKLYSIPRNKIHTRITYTNIRIFISVD